MRTPTAAEIHRALNGPLVPCGIKGFGHVMVGDVRRGRSPRVVSVLAVALENGAVSWAKRIFMSPLDDTVIALQSAAQRN